LGTELIIDKKIETILWEYIRINFMPPNSDLKYQFNDDLLNDGIIDSAGLVSFVVFIEEEFDLQIPDEDLLPQNFSSLTTAADYIRSKM
jgi:acyl carrier protein